MQKKTYVYNMPLTLEKHFENLAQTYPAVKEIHSVWILLRKEMEERLVHSSNVFVNYSLHDKSHCYSVIQSVERFLGEERICRLSATDTFMLLACIYSHDYGMAQTYNKIYEILGSEKFELFLAEKEKDSGSMENEDAWAVHNLYQYLNENGREKSKFHLNDLYFSIMLVIQLYLRPLHWRGVIDIRDIFEGLFQEHLKKRFIYGSEGIVEICMCHGRPIDDLFKLSYCADGMAGDEYHPRFVAAMLRLGDLLDLDNGRFPAWFVNEVAQNKNMIPRLSVLHYRKHEAVSHLLITPEEIEIVAQCYSKETDWRREENKQRREVMKEQAQQDSYDVAALVYDWTEQLSDECREMIWNWNKIAQPDFGCPPAMPKVNIYVDGREYMAENKAFQMRMSQERVMKLLKGTSIYKNRYVGIREMIQNAIDASLLRLWKDLLQNRYSSCGLSKYKALESLDLFDLLDEKKASIFNNYQISVEVIEDRMRKQVFVVVKDKGIGITTEDVRYMAELGSSKESNDRIQKLVEKMPKWMKPSGIFGIGLQSVFQLTDCIEFYTRQHNKPEQQILLYSYGKNCGKIETREIAADSTESYYDNAIPGTNVRIAISPEKYFGKDGQQNKNAFLYYDPEFDADEELHMLFVEVAKACEKEFKKSVYDYFNISYETIIIEKDGRERDKENARKNYRYSYICPPDKLKKSEKELRSFGRNLYSLRNYDLYDSYIFDAKHALFWDKETCRCYRLTVRSCEIDQDNYLTFPEKIKSLYDLSYKFNQISNVETIYAQSNGSNHLHAGFLKLEVLILDDQPMKYMNIDRDRLREDAVDEEELIAIRKKIVRRWCEYLCEGEENTKEEYPSKKAENIEKKKQEKRRQIKGVYQSQPGVLISLILLFYQVVPEELFQLFLARYYSITENFKETGHSDKTAVIDIKLKGEKIKVSELWDSHRTFWTRIDLPDKIRCEDDEKKGIGCCKIGVECIRRLPHSLVRIKSVWIEGDKICYSFRLQASNPEIKCVEMSEVARLYDYMYALNWDTDCKSIKRESLIKTVFKPDEQYKNLAVPCFPRTFQKGKNMGTEMDNCISSYILSPFDMESIKKLSKIFKEDDKTGEANSVEKKVKEIIEEVMKSRQLEKCIAYILKKGAVAGENEAEKEESVRKDYEKFLEDFCNLLVKYREVVR